MHKYFQKGEETRRVSLIAKGKRGFINADSLFKGQRALKKKKENMK